MFLDIEMPDTNGLDVAVKIREENQEVPIIFISWHQKYEHQSFLVHPFSFIDKNNFKEELESCLNDLLKDFHRKNDDFILSNREHISSKTYPLYGKTGALYPYSYGFTFGDYIIGCFTCVIVSWIFSKLYLDKLIPEAILRN